jgi:esterase
MQLNFRKYGEGPPIVILHGLFGMLDNWHTVSKMLAASFQVFAVDQRNHGQSPHSDEFDYHVLAQDIRDFLGEHGIRSTSILGHSMGGKTAMRVALKFPELVEKLIVVDIAPRAYTSLHDEILEALTSLQLHRFASRNAIDAELGNKVPDAAVRQFLMKNLARDENGTFLWKMNLPVIAKNYGRILEGIETQSSFLKSSLFIRSRKSSYIREQDIPEIKRLFPYSSFAGFETGHWVHAEAPEQLTRTVTDFLLKQ